MKVAVVYGSSMGSTEEAANIIAEKLGLKAINIANLTPSELNEYDKLVCGTSTWNSGDLQDDWDDFNFEELNLSGKTIALFGVGDSLSYDDSFCDGMGILYENFKKLGADIVGAVSSDGYDFTSSRALVDDKFVGLALDFDNQSDKNEERISNWIDIIKEYFI